MSKTIAKSDIGSRYQEDKTFRNHWKEYMKQRRPSGSDVNKVAYLKSKNSRTEEQKAARAEYLKKYRRDRNIFIARFYNLHYRDMIKFVKSLKNMSSDGKLNCLVEYIQQFEDDMEFSYDIDRKISRRSAVQIAKYFKRYHKQLFK